MKLSRLSSNLKSSDFKFQHIDSVLEQTILKRHYSNTTQF